MNNKIQVTLCNIKTNTKPKQIGMYQLLKNSSYKELDYKELGDAVTNGCYSFHCGKFNMEDVTGSFNKNSFIESNLFCLDIDSGNYTLEEILQITGEYKPAIIYNTFSSTEDNKRYRIMYVGNKKVNREKTERIIIFLMSIFTNLSINKEPDTHCKDANRFFISGKELKYCKDNIIDVDYILNNFTEEDKEDFLYKVKEFKRQKEGKKPSKPRKTTKVKKENISILYTKEEWEEKIIYKLINYKFKEKPLEIDVHDAFNFINNLSMEYLIGEQIGKPFCCVLHMDSNPSAAILKVDGKDRYKCFACTDKTLGTLDLLSKLLKKDSLKTVEFVLKHLEIQLGSKYQIESEEILMNNMKLISKNRNNKLYKILSSRNLLGYYTLLNQYAINFINFKPVTNTTNPTFFAGVRRLAAFFNDMGLKGADFINVSKKLNTLCSLGLLEKVNWEDLDPNLKSKAIEFQIKYGMEKKTTYWIIPTLTKEVIKNAINIIEGNKKNGVKTKGFSKTQQSLLHGENNASKIFQQNETNINFDFFNILNNIVNDVYSKGYFTEKEIIEVLNKKGLKNIEYRVNVYLPSIVQAMELTKTRINKDLRAKLNIPDTLKPQNNIFTKIEN